jgi:oligoendopeptidase F
VSRLALVAFSIFLAAAGASAGYTIDLSRYFSSGAAEATSRAAALAEARAFVRSATPRSAPALYAWLQRYDSLLRLLERHDVYVYLRAEEDDRDVADAGADDALGGVEETLYERISNAAKELGTADVISLTAQPPLMAYRYLLQRALLASKHRLSAADVRAVATAVTPVLESAATTYKALRKANDPIAEHQDAYAALLVSIVSANTGIARLRGFTGAAEASYFDKSLSAASVQRTLNAVRASRAYGRFRQVATSAPQPEFTPAPVAIADAIPLILAAEQPMGTQYSNQYEALYAPANARLDICTEPNCDATGFSVGFSQVTSAAFFGDYDGSVNSMRAVAHESGHAVHRQFMNLFQPIAAYNEGPHFMFESFAIFNELLFLDHLYRTAPNDAQRAYYLKYFLTDATFQVYGSAEETDLESAIYRGVAARSLRTAADLDKLTTATFATYDPTSAKDPSTPLYWARNRLFFSDPLYDVNYLYAGLLALRYFDDYRRNPQDFSRRYVALLENGFNADPAVLEKKFLGIDLND